MPSNRIFFSVMFVGKYSCTSHVLQYSSSLSYEHSRSLQSILCPGVVTVLICWASLHVFSPRQSWCEHPFVRMAWRKRSFFVAALLLIYINLKNGGKITHFFTIRQTFLHFFSYSEELASISIILSLFLCTFAHLVAPIIFRSISKLLGVSLLSWTYSLYLIQQSIYQTNNP
jgi:hypothetical protein